MAGPYLFLRDPLPISGNGDGTWKPLCPADPSREAMTIAVAGPGEVYLRIKNAGGTATAGIPMIAAGGWYRLDRETAPDFITREFFFIAPAGTNVRGFAVGGLATE